MEKNKKGIGLNHAFMAIMTLVLVAVLVIIGIYMFQALSTTMPQTSASVINESGWLNGTGYTLSKSTVCNFLSPLIIAVSNGSGIYTSGNYTLVGNVIYNTSSLTMAPANITYSYNWGGQACIAAQSMVTQFSSYPTLVGLVGTIILLGIVIGVLVASFVFGGRRKP